MVNGWLFGLDSATLAQLLTDYQNALTAVATTGQSYSIGGRTFTRADLSEIGQMIAEIKAAQNKASGTRVTKIYTDFRR